MVKLYLIIEIFYQVITKLFWYFDLLNTQKEVHTQTKNNQRIQNVLQPTIWPPTTKYLPLTSHLSDFHLGRGSASATFYYCQRQYY